MATLNRNDIIGALGRLGQLAVAEGLTIELIAMGGAVMVLAYNARLSTRDVDVLIVTPQDAQRIRRLARRVAVGTAG